MANTDVSRALAAAQGSMATALVFLALFPWCEVQAQEQPLSSILGEVRVLTCALDNDIGVVAYREGDDGALTGLGAFADAQFVREGERITILQGVDVLSIDGMSATSIRDGITSQGRCVDAGEAMGVILAAILGGSVDQAGRDLLTELEAARADAGLGRLRAERMRRDLVAAEARAAQAEATAREAGEAQAAAEASARTALSSLGVLHRTVARQRDRVEELQAELEAAQATIEEAEADVPCAETVRRNLVSDLFIGELSQIERQAVSIIADACGVVLGPP